MAFKRKNKNIRYFVIAGLALLMLVCYFYTNSLQESIPLQEITQEYKLNVKV